MSIELMQGDCLEKMKDIPDESIDAIVTDPPYGLGFMGKEWDKLPPGKEVFEECLRVLKPGGHLLSFGGTRTYHRMAVAIEDAGFEIRDMIEWVYGSGFPKSHNIGVAVDKLQGNEREKVGETVSGKILRSNGQNERPYQQGQDRITTNLTKGTSEWEGWGSSMKPSHEPIAFCRKPLEKGLTIAENCLRWGTGGINIDESRVGTTDELKEQKAKGSNGGEAYGDYNLDATYIPSNLGRFPANLIHDNSEEVRECFPETKAGVAVRRNGNNAKGIFPVKIAEGSADVGFNDSGNASRFFKSIIYQAKASKAERNKGCEGLEEVELKRTMSGGADTRGRPTPINKNNHPTVKPVALMEYLINMVTREGQTVLDPFMGSGTTGVACKNLNRNFIGIELDPEYFKIAEKRIGKDWRPRGKPATCPRGRLPLC